VTAAGNVRAQFEALLENNSLALSACSGAFRKAIKPLLDSGVVVEERSGAGRRLAVRHGAALRAFFTKRFPDTPVFQGASSRATAVARFRKSKALKSDLPEIICVRAWREDALFCEQQPAAAAAATAKHGVFCFLLGKDSAYTIRGKCALVENPDVFANFERLKLPVALVIYSHGRISNRLIDWLARMTAADFALLHLPDYDPVGLGDFERLRARLGPRAALHLPPDLPELFARHSDRSLLDKANSRTLLANLQHSPNAEIQQVLKLIAHHNAGLEQEALLL